MTNKTLIKQAHSGSKQAEELLVQNNMPLVKSIAVRFLGRGLDIDDICQIGCVGMLKAIRNFNLDLGAEFSTYAVHLITGEIRRYFRDNSYIKVSRSMRELAIKAFSVRDSIFSKEGREASVSEIAASLNSDVESVVTAMESQLPPEYLYKKTGDGDTYMIDTLIKNDGISDEAISLDIAIDMLEENDKTIVRGRYFEGKTQSEVAKILGVSQVQVSRREKRILAFLKSRMA